MGTDVGVGVIVRHIVGCVVIAVITRLSVVTYVVVVVDGYCVCVAVAAG